MNEGSKVNGLGSDGVVQRCLEFALNERLTVLGGPGDMIEEPPIRHGCLLVWRSKLAQGRSEWLEKPRVVGPIGASKRLRSLSVGV